MSVKIAIFSFINKVLGLVRLKPLTLGEKCRLQFGAAILVVLTIALLIPYFWISKLTEKISLDSGRAVANTIFERHFQVELPPEKELSPLLESGDKRQPENRAVKWIRLDTEDKLAGKTLSAYQNEIIKLLVESH
jgi:two-component system sensor histidine kinase BarA